MDGGGGLGLTRAGQKHLAAEQKDWERRSGAVGRLLAAEG